MNFFNNLGKSIGEMAKQAGEKSGELLEVGRLNIEIYREEDAIRRICRKIGEQIYHLYDQDKQYGGEADELCAEIKDRKKKIEELKEKIKEIRKAEDERAGRMSGEKDGEEGGNNDEKGKRKDSDNREPDIPYYTAMEMMKEENNLHASGSSLGEVFK